MHGESILAHGVTHVRVRVARAASPRFAFEVPFRRTQTEGDCGRDESRESDSHEAQSGCGGGDALRQAKPIGAKLKAAARRCV